MLCVICLKNNATLAVVCGSCQELNLPNHNKKVEISIGKRLSELPVDRQFKIIQLTHRRFHSLLEYNLSREFILSNVLNEYLDMESRNDDLDMLVSDRPYRGQSYDQYQSPKKE